MAITTGPVTLFGEHSAEPVERKFKAVKLFAFIGALFLVLETLVPPDTEDTPIFVSSP